MRTQIGLALLVCLLLSSCVTPSPVPSTLSPDLAATTDAAVAQTMLAQQAINQTIQTSVAATIAAQPTATPTPAVETLSEEEVAAMVDAAVAEALNSSQAVTTANDSASQDALVTDEEATEMVVLIEDAEEALLYAEYWLNLYEDLYGEYEDETIDDLDAIIQDLEAIDQSLQMMLDIWEQGSDAATQAMQTLNSAAQTMQQNLTEVQVKSQGWLSAVQEQLQMREKQVLSVQPNAVASNRVEALASVRSYVQEMKVALTDQKISPAELNTLAQLAANANASLAAHGGPQLAGLQASIQALTVQAARGQVPQLKTSLMELEAAIPGR